MKKTRWAMAARQITIYGDILYRAVWEKDGRYYIKDRGEVIDVTDRENEFTPKWIIGMKG